MRYNHPRPKPKNKQTKKTAQEHTCQKNPDPKTRKMSTSRNTTHQIPSRKGCVVNGQTIKANNKSVRPPRKKIQGIVKRKHIECSEEGVHLRSMVRTVGRCLTNSPWCLFYTWYELLASGGIIAGAMAMIFLFNVFLPLKAGSSFH